MSEQKYNINGKRVTIKSDGHIFVNGKKTNIKQWKSSKTNYSNLSGQEQKDLKGMDVKRALSLRGLV